MMYRFCRDSRSIPLILGLLLGSALFSSEYRQHIPLQDGWRSVAHAEGTATADTWLHPCFDDSSWTSVSVPHNWETYEGYRQLKHGNYHGTAWYRKTFHLPEMNADQRVFLFFEGVGSYATVWVNGKEVGQHAGGLTTFTIDISEVASADISNLLVVKADHPAHIRDLPWVCGGCEQAYGFSEGTQPFGISRPVQLIITNQLRIAPFGVHVWNGQDISDKKAVLNIATTLTNNGSAGTEFCLRTSIRDADGNELLMKRKSASIDPGESVELRQTSPVIEQPRLWSPEDPCLYTIISTVIVNGKEVDRIETPYGIRWVEWPDLQGPPGQPLRINGQPVFINGVADYEHLIGKSHAFSNEQVLARARQIQAAGFNAFRDAHHPHNLRFNRFWDEQGILWWTQFGAHIWFENEAFKETFKKRLRDWIRERRNSPSLFLYGLQNESKLPASFASECVEIIREMDPTASIQRPIVTCNGGSGTDWDVPQNWSGTYGGNPDAYADELREQRLVGEYGAWRSIGYHSEGGFQQDGPLTESRMTALMEKKDRLANSVAGDVIGHFTWPFTTHQNPGRNVGSRGQQTVDGIRELDRIGPANNKGLTTIWGEPLDVFHMYRSHHTPVEDHPMVYIASHTWPDRWSSTGIKDSIVVYSNADEVELFNGFKGRSLGVRQKEDLLGHFRWDDVLINNNTLYAEARHNGRIVATDIITLHHLPEDPGLADYDPDPPNLTQPEAGYHYLYRVNAGGESYTDMNGNPWMADHVYQQGDTWGSLSWAGNYPNLHPMFGSKREIFDPVLGTSDDPLFQSFRYGRNQLEYRFKVPDGDYRIELYFIEPWYGTGGGLDCAGWRQFDVAVNGRVQLPELDIWAESGRAKATRKVVNASACDGQLRIHFPEVQAGQAVISAIAIATLEEVPSPMAPQRLLAADSLAADEINFRLRSFIDTGTPLFMNSNDSIHFLSWELREAEWIQVGNRPGLHGNIGDLVRVNANADVFLLVSLSTDEADNWLAGWEKTPFYLTTAQSPDQQHVAYRKQVQSGELLGLPPRKSPGGSNWVTVIAKQQFPPPPAIAIHEFTVRDSLAPADWQTLGNLQAGRRLYSDGGPSIQQYTTRLGGIDWIRPPQADASNPGLSAAFAVEDHTEVFVGVDERLALVPSWMQDWIPTDWSLRTHGEHGRTYRFLKHRFAPGEKVALGPNAHLPDGNPAAMYTVLVRTVRPDQWYDAPKIINDSMDWIISVGVGDRYGLNFQYRSSLEETLPASMEIISTRDGGLVCADAIEFGPTPGGEFQFSRNRTCDSINAGTYIIRISAPGLSSLQFERLQVE